MTRGAAGHWLVNGAWSPDPPVPYRAEYSSTTRGQSQQAIGTKQTTGCLYNTGSPQSYIADVWEGDDEPSSMYWIWNGVDIPGGYQTPNYGTITWNGFTYYKGRMIANTNIGQEGQDTMWFEICRR